MNEENKHLFFDEDSEYTATITVTDEDNNEIEAEIIASVEIEELGKEFVALLPTSAKPDDMAEVEALILEYSEDEEGEPVFTPIEDEELFDVVSEAFDQFFTELTDEEEEEEEESGDYLDNLRILPGVSIKKD
jgi:Uncharacterized protein conserved in bacteria